MDAGYEANNNNGDTKACSGFYFHRSDGFWPAFPPAAVARLETSPQSELVDTRAFINYTIVFQGMIMDVCLGGLKESS